MDFTDRYVASLKPRSKQYVERERRGFAIRVLPTGQKTFLFIYTFDGQRRQLNLGTYPSQTLAEARAAHAAAYAMLHDPGNPRDPLGERTQRQDRERQEREEIRKRPTIARLVEEYVENFAKEKKKTWAEDKRILEKDVLPVWGDRKARDIERRDVLLLIESMKRRGPAITLNTFKIIRVCSGTPSSRKSSDNPPASASKRMTSCRLSLAASVTSMPRKSGSSGRA